MKRYCSLLLAGLMLAAPGPGSAQTSPLQAVPASGLPDLRQAQDPQYRAAAYPSWRGDVVLGGALEEHKRSEGGVLGLLTLNLESDSWVSVLYYAGTGRGLELLDGLPIPSGQQTTLSFPLPPGDVGVTRLLVWDARPTAGALRQLEEQALDPARRLAGVVDERWFGRSKPGPVSLPYSEHDLAVPPGFFRARGPSVRAALAPSGTAITRNCSVYFRGPVRFSSDSWGSFGQWQLTAGTPLELKMVLPGRRDYTRALLRVQGELAGPLAPREPVKLRLEVNGWRDEEVPLAGGIGDAEQVSFDVSQSIEYGLNSFSLRNEGFGSEWLVRRLELWIE